MVSNIKEEISLTISTFYYRHGFVVAVQFCAHNQAKQRPSAQLILKMKWNAVQLCFSAVSFHCFQSNLLLNERREKEKSPKNEKFCLSPLATILCEKTNLPGSSSS